MQHPDSPAGPKPPPTEIADSVHFSSSKSPNTSHSTNHSQLSSYDKLCNVSESSQKVHSTMNVHSDDTDLTLNSFKKVNDFTSSSVTRTEKDFAVSSTQYEKIELERQNSTNSSDMLNINTLDSKLSSTTSNHSVAQQNNEELQEKECDNTETGRDMSTQTEDEAFVNVARDSVASEFVESSFEESMEEDYIKGYDYSIQTDADLFDNKTDETESSSDQDHQKVELISKSNKTSLSAYSDSKVSYSTKVDTDNVTRGTDTKMFPTSATLYNSVKTDKSTKDLNIADTNLSLTGNVSSTDRPAMMLLNEQTSCPQMESFDTVTLHEYGEMISIISDSSPIHSRIQATKERKQEVSRMLDSLRLSSSSK